MTDQPPIEDVPGQQSRFQELARLGQVVIDADARIAALHARNVDLQRALTRHRKQPGSGADAGMAARLKEAQDSVRALTSDVTRLTEAVASKERDRFALQEEAWALSEALAQLQQAQGKTTDDGPALADYVQEVVRLTALLRAAEDQVEALETSLAERALEPVAAPDAGQTGGLDPDGLRVQMTGLVADRDRARLAAGQAADFASLATPAEGFVFVVTYGHSGDVELQDLINRIGGVCLRGENAGVINQLADTWQSAAEAADRAKDRAGAAFDRLNRLGWSLADGFAASVLALPQGTRVGGFREIRWSEDAGEFARRLDFLHAFFPAARFVFHSREPRDVAKLGWWAEQPETQVVEALERRCALFDRYLEAHPERGIRLHYDDYMTAPEQLAPLFDLLGADWSAEMVADWMAEQGA